MEIHPAGAPDSPTDVDGLLGSDPGTNEHSGAAPDVGGDNYPDADQGTTHPSPDTCVGDPDTRAHAGLDTDE